MEEVYTFMLASYYIFIGITIVGSLMAYFWIPKAIRMAFDADEDITEESIRE
tara:strand:- start:427 stop:582 length:156 start_codon:yes stop_codon:yes gene_type:complete